MSCDRQNRITTSNFAFERFDNDPRKAIVEMIRKPRTSPPPRFARSTPSGTSPLANFLGSYLTSVGA